MIPSVISSQVRQGIEDFLKTTFPTANPFFHGVLEDFLSAPGNIFKGPYISLKLPFKTGDGTKEFFSDIPLGFPSYLHQEQAFQRLSGSETKSTIISTGTGSGKTECFMYPLLDYCYKNRDKRGIKAIIVYPMNALANDQSKRFAKEIYNNPKLKDNVTVGLYVGGLDGKDAKTMGEEHVITNRDTLRLTPPDILLTNYKMLDYMLIRARDRELWKENEPDTLKYLVVDELHTFDGAQGTDLACLIRRLKNRLRTSQNHLACVGTSATMGGGEDENELIEFAKALFGEEFDDNSVITEQLMQPYEFLNDREVTVSEIIHPDDTDKLDPASYDVFQEYINAQNEVWFSDSDDVANDSGAQYRLKEKILGHLFFNYLLRILKNRTIELQDIISDVAQSIPEYAEGQERYKRLIIESFLALVSVARTEKDGKSYPFLNLRCQLWTRELRRIVSDVNDPPVLRFNDDLKPEQLESHLPYIHCRECGESGWGGTLRLQDTVLDSDLQRFYAAFFSKSPTVHFIFPGKDSQPMQDKQLEFQRKLCGYCMRINDGIETKVCAGCGRDDKLVPVFIHNERKKLKSRDICLHDCPYCGGHDSLTIMGSRAASLISVVIAQLYSTTYNQDKKLLTFSDSVQDASHRAGFFKGRTFQFNLRGAIQKVVEKANGNIVLKDLPKIFADNWKNEWKSEEKFVTGFLPPDMAWFEDYQELIEKSKMPAKSDLIEQVQNRLSWEIYSEYCYRSRIGRTLEKSLCSVADFSSEQIDKAVTSCADKVKNEIGGLTELAGSDLQRLICGMLQQLRIHGAVFHPALEAFINDMGNTYLINRIEYMPGFRKNSRAPSFLTTRRGTRFSQLTSQTKGAQTWYEIWLQKCIGHLNGSIAEFAEQFYAIILEALVDADVLDKRTVKGDQLWGIKPEALSVGKNVALIKCNICGQTLSTSSEAAGVWEDMPCMRVRCRGTFSIDTKEHNDYYGKLYSSGKFERVFAEEHTGLLERKDREALESSFIDRKNPWDPNLISCTPTLEMGIDIGDLSASVLCSVPPGTGNYLQRIGRTGRSNGNSFLLTVAAGKPHDLYFYAEPSEMFAGKVETPGVFLNAAAVLERQFVAFCFDKWLASEPGKLDVPHFMEKVISNLNKKGNKLFPGNLLSYIDAHKAKLLGEFCSMFEPYLGDDAKEHLRNFCSVTTSTGEESSSGISYKICNSIRMVEKEISTLRKKVQAITKTLKEKESVTVKDKNYEVEVGSLDIEKKAFNRIIRDLNKKNTYSFLTDEGILPNYAFPEAGVILRSVILKKSKKAEHSKADVYEYERPAMAAIHELAPTNSFYANGRKLTVDQVMDTTEPEEWRFCNNCTHMQLEIHVDTKTCPECGSTLWGDDNQKRQMLKMRQVMATSWDRESRVKDDNDVREPQFFNKSLAVDIEQENISKAYKLDDQQLPFGFEFVKKVMFREVNFGRQDALGETVDIAGKQVPQSGFIVCKECGKVQDTRNEKENHAYSCSSRKNTERKSKKMDCLFLYREFPSEAIRILLPTISQPGFFESKVQSFTAAVHVGLKRKFKGNIDHLQVCVIDEPITGSDLRKHYLILYDSVPGGTGYLKELMLSEKPLIEVFQLALESIKACSCGDDPEKDGCYRCLYAYRSSFDIPKISRNTAILLLTDILARRDLFVETDSVAGISQNALFDSKLEEHFIDKLRESKYQGQVVEMREDVINGKPGFYLKINDNGYYIEPQVDAPEGIVKIKSRPDFVLYPEKGSTCKPIAVFTDGFAFHAEKTYKHSIVGSDIAKRMALVQSGKFNVWSLTWHDVMEDGRASISSWLTNMTSDVIGFSKKQFDLDPSLFRQLRSWDPFETLVQFLAHPQEELWQLNAYIQALSLIKGSTNCMDDSGIRTIQENFLSNELWEDIDLKKLNNSGFKGQLKIDKYRDDNNALNIFAFGEDKALSSKSTEACRIMCRFFDEDKYFQDDEYKTAWNNFLSLYNIFQFLPGSWFVTSQGIIDNAYSPLDQNAVLRFAEPSEVVPAISESVEEIEELKDITDGDIHFLFDIIQEKKLQLPEVGYEFINASGTVAGETELGWGDRKIAVLTDEQKKVISSDLLEDWQIFEYNKVINESDSLIESLEKGG